MDIEFEARFLDIDTTVVRGKLAAQGGVCVMPRTLMRRIVFKNKDITERGGWAPPTRRGPSSHDDLQADHQRHLRCLTRQR